jgi:hypothetical protein
LDDRKAAAHFDENPGDGRVLVAGVPTHHDVADSPDSCVRGVTDGTPENLGERDHSVGDGPAERSVLT